MTTKPSEESLRTPTKDEDLEAALSGRFYKKKTRGGISSVNDHGQAPGTAILGS